MTNFKVFRWNFWLGTNLEIRRRGCTIFVQICIFSLLFKKGTTTTGLLAALTAEPSELAHAIQIALCHLFFNVIGILTFYPIPFMRWPIPLAKAFGRKVFKHRWFALVYILLTFFILPVYVSSKKYSFFHYIHFKLVPSPSVLIENNFLGCWTIIFSKFCSTIYWSYCSNYQHITYCNYQCYASYETNLASK